MHDEKLIALGCPTHYNGHHIWQYAWPICHEFDQHTFGSLPRGATTFLLTNTRFGNKVLSFGHVAQSCHGDLGQQRLNNKQQRYR